MIKELAAIAFDKSLLIVEDEKDLVEELQELFSLFYKDVDIAFDGVEAIELIENKKYDIITTDFNMPRKNGLELIHEIKEQKLACPKIIILSAEQENDSIQELKEQGLTVLSKPIEDNELFEAMINILNKN